MEQGKQACCPRVGGADSDFGSTEDAWGTEASVLARTGSHWDSSQLISDLGPHVCK